MFLEYHYPVLHNSTIAKSMFLSYHHLLLLSLECQNVSSSPILQTFATTLETLSRWSWITLVNTSCKNNGTNLSYLILYNNNMVLVKCGLNVKMSTEAKVDQYVGPARETTPQTQKQWYCALLIKFSSNSKKHILVACPNPWQGQQTPALYEIKTEATSVLNPTKFESPQYSSCSKAWFKLPLKLGLKRADPSIEDQAPRRASRCTTCISIPHSYSMKMNSLSHSWEQGALLQNYTYKKQKLQNPRGFVIKLRERVLPPQRTWSIWWCGVVLGPRLKQNELLLLQENQLHPVLPAHTIIFQVVDIQARN